MMMMVPLNKKNDDAFLEKLIAKICERPFDFWIKEQRFGNKWIWSSSNLLYNEKIKIVYYEKKEIEIIIFYTDKIHERFYLYNFYKKSSIQKFLIWIEELIKYDIKKNKEQLNKRRQQLLLSMEWKHDSSIKNQLLKR